MTDLEKEIAEQKRVARCARNRVSGAKSKRCTLPSDHLTPAQRDKLNGEVQTWCLNAPMDFKTFQEMPVDLQRQYIDSLQEQYDASLTGIAQMMSTSYPTLQKYVTAAGLKVRSIANRSRTKAFLWRCFQSGVSPETAPEPEQGPTPEPGSEPVTEMLAEPAPEKVADSDRMRLTRFVLEGVYQELELKQAPDLLIRPGSAVRITVERL